MKRLKRILPIIIAIFMIIITLTDCSKKAVSTITTSEKPVKVAAFLQDFTDDLISEIRQYLEAIQRTKSSVSAIEKSGIKIQEVALKICDWNEDLAYNAIKSLFGKYGDQIEVIISNDDTMAIGAIKALQEYGYNKGDKSKTIPVVGVDVTPVAKDFIEKGYMLGSVYQYPKDYADALYACGMNLVANKNPVEGTKYKLDDTRVAIRLPQTDYLYKNMFL